MERSKDSFDLSSSQTAPHLAMTKFEPNELDTFWPRLEDMLLAVPHTCRHWTLEYVYNSLMAGHLQAWGVGPPPNAVFVFFTQIAVYPAMKVLSLVWGAGSFDPEMLPLIEATMINYAKFAQCDEIELRGRPGWEPHLKRVGFRREATIWSRQVPNVRVN